MKLIDIKNEVYEALGVTTTKEVKALYPTRNLTLKTEWEAILDELTAGQLNDKGVNNSPAVWEGSETSEAFPTTSDESGGETSDRAGADVAEDDLEPDLIPPSPDAPMAPVPVALWDFIPGHNLVAALSPWAHYLEWLDRLYTHTFAVVESTFWSYENA